MEGALAAPLTNLEAVCTHAALAIDELEFTRGPCLLFFENITSEVLGPPASAR